MIELENVQKIQDEQINGLERLVKRLERKRTITVDVFQGCVQEVHNLPKGWSYKVKDNDVLDNNT